MTTPLTIGDYRVICPLGEGGMARVYLCATSGIGGFRKLIVVKALRSDLASDSEFLDMFLDEARIAGRLNHPNVVQTNEVGIADGTHFIAMEYLEGQPLSSVLKRIGRKKMPLDLHIRILSDALLGLHYAHELRDFNGQPLNVVHRDVSPQNIFVTYDGVTKMVDFGIAKAAGSAAYTREGILKGKVAYMAPEQAAMDPVDRRADIFAMGVMLWEAMAQHRLVPSGSDDLAALNRRLAGKEPAIRDEVHDAPPRLAEICDRAMSNSKSNRYSTAAEMRADLEEYAINHSRATSDVAHFMNDVFAEDRKALRDLIEEQLRNPSQAPVPYIAPSVTDSSGDSNSEASTRSIKMLPDKAPPKGARYALIGGALLVAGAAALYAFRPSPPPESTSSASTPPPAQPPTSTPSAIPSEATAATTSEVRVKIVIAPPNAEISIDGERTSSNPFATSVPRSAKEHRIEATAPGFAKQEQMVVFDHDIEVMMSLAPLPRSIPVRGAKPHEDSTSAPKTPKAGRAIDDKDPYQ